jgi:hypothetical protein
MADTKSRFAALKSFREQAAETETPADAPEPYNPPAPPPASPAAPSIAAGKGRGRPAGKRSNPDFEPTTVLLRTKTKRAAGRLLEDTEADKDLSDLIESLLGEWISRRS